MPRRKGLLAKADAIAICGRLNKFSKRYGTRGEFAQRFGVPRTTLRTWTQKKNATVPALAYLLRIAREGNVNLNWLFLGEGSELRERETVTPRGAALAAVAAELQATEPADRADHEQVWAYLAIESDAAFSLAVEAIRPEYRRRLNGLRSLEILSRNLTRLYEAVLETKAADKQKEDVLGAVAELQALAKAGVFEQ